MSIFGRKTKKVIQNQQREIESLRMLVHVLLEAGHAILQYGFTLRKKDSGLSHDALMQELKEKYCVNGQDLHLAITDSGELLLMDGQYKYVQRLDKHKYQLDWEPCGYDVTSADEHRKRLLPRGISYTLSDDEQTLFVWHDGQHIVVDGSTSVEKS